MVKLLKMKNILLITIFISTLLANNSSVVTKKIDMGNDNYVYVDQDKEWDYEGTLFFSRNLQCYTLSSSNMSCMDGNYDQELLSLKKIIFLDVDYMIGSRKTLSNESLQNYKDIYENFSFKDSSYEVLFAYLFIVADYYSKNPKKVIELDVSKIFSTNPFFLSSKNDVKNYNNMAFFLQKYGANKESVFILNQILKKYPQRTVAYINLADAYWELGKKKQAKMAYKSYIKQMKSKEKKIPMRVFDRLKIL